jgi:2-aminoadipate transaminase
MILEDDLYRQISFAALPPLRVGWMLVPPTVIQRCVGCGTSLMGGGASPLAEAFAAAYLGSNKWDAHLVRLRERYRLRRDVALDALAEFMPHGVRWTVPNGCFFIWIQLPNSVTAGRVADLANKNDVQVADGASFFVNAEDGLQCLRLAFSFAPVGRQTPPEHRPAMLERP